MFTLSRAVKSTASAAVALAVVLLLGLGVNLGLVFDQDLRVLDEADHALPRLVPARVKRRLAVPGRDGEIFGVVNRAEENSEKRVARPDRLNL